MATFADAVTNQQSDIANQPVVPVTPSASAKATYDPSTSTAENLEQLTQEGGSYLSVAKQQGESAARRRGLGNTTLAGQAAMGSAIQAAAPIAESDAAKEQQKLLQDKEFAQEKELQEGQFLQQKELQKMQDEQAKRLAQMGIDQEQWKLGATVSSNLQGQYASSLDEILNQYAISVNQIETAQDISTADKNAMIQNSVERRNADMNFLKNMYSAMPGFNTDWGVFPSA